MDGRHLGKGRAICGAIAVALTVASPVIAVASLVDAVARVALGALSAIAVMVTLGMWDKPKNAFCRHSAHLWNDLYGAVAYPLFVASAYLGVIHPIIPIISAHVLSVPLIDTEMLSESLSSNY